MENPSIQSNEIVKINKNGHYPQKVFDEGNSLDIETNVHSFFWNYDGHNQIDDFEPVAVSKAHNFALTRFHYRGLLLWVDYKEEDGKPIVEFFTRYHTPLLCTNHSIHYDKTPVRIEDAMYFDILLAAYFASDKFRTMRNKKYATRDYTLDSGVVPETRKFNWSELEYLVIIGPRQVLDSEALPNKLKRRLNEITRK